MIQGDTRELCEEAVARSAELFDSLSFTIRPRKSVFAPIQTIEFFGFCAGLQKYDSVVIHIPKVRS